MTMRLSITVNTCRSIVAFIVAVLLLTQNTWSDERADESAGLRIYRAQCIKCHGPAGEGVEDVHDQPLYGDRTLASLTERIVKTMPKDKEGACVGEDAQAVARYIYDAFYSPQARAKRSPAVRPDLTHLTVAQYRQSAADLVGGFRNGWGRDYGPDRGLEIRFNGRRPSKKKNDKKNSVDQRQRVQSVAFDLEHDWPFDDLDPKEKLNVTWTGSLLAPDTGEYELVIRTPNGAKLWFNETERDAPPLIDGGVVSGVDVRDVQQCVFLVEGRAYPLRLEWERSSKAKHASIELLWKTPHGPLQRVPGRAMLPHTAPSVTIVATPFPADDASLGYERGSGVSAGWYEAVTNAALDVASQTAADINTLAGTKRGDADRQAKIRKFCESFVARAIRRPLDESARRMFIDRHFDSAAEPEQAAKRVVLQVLSSGSFLYPEARKSPVDSHRAAARLALYLWDSLPDESLRTAAERDELLDPKNVQAHARRMLADPRTRTKLHGFFHHWLELGRAEGITKDAEVFPGFDEQVLSDLRVSLDEFLEHVVWSETSDYRELLLADYLFLNERLSKLYAPESSAGLGEEYRKTALPDRRRSGVITHPYLLTAFAYHNSTSPIHRGVFLTRNIVGRALKPPPNAIEFEQSKFDPSLTMREKVAEFTRASACMACHSTINPLGFSLEHFDGIGRWRTQEKDKPIDATGELPGDDGRSVRLSGARDVAEFAVNSRAAQRAFIRQLFHHTIKQDTSAFGPDALDRLEASFRDSNFHIRNLLATIAARAAMDGVAVKTTTTSTSVK
jgi:mono/diheme cytochrome c family protein